VGGGLFADAQGNAGQTNEIMTLSSKLLDILRDPVDRSPLEVEPNALVNRATGRRYPVIDGIPALLDEADVGAQNRRIRDMYRWMSRGFDVADRIGDLVTFGLLSKTRRTLAARLDLKPGDRCLYVSVGTGLDLPFFAERVSLQAIEFVGLDLSREMLLKCRKKILRRWPGPGLVQANAERLPFADGAFDVVFHLGGINLFDRPAEAVREMHRVARPGALVLIADETPQAIQSQYQKANPFTRKACRGISTDFDPRDWVPPQATDRGYETIFKGKGYALSFRAGVDRPSDAPSTGATASG
jgi:ubiquinone/menaquinone biosynthesis C-methylase UbiE